MTPLKRFCLMLALVCMWSPSFLFIKLAVQELPPTIVVGLRVTLAAIVLLGILFWKRVSLPIEWGFWIKTVVMAFFSSVFPFCLFCYAEKSIDSALAAILNGTTPMFTAVLAQIFVVSDRLTPQKILGIVLSSAGVIWLFTPQLQEGVSGTALGMSAALLASLCYGISHVYGKLFITGQKPFVAPTAQMIASAVMLWPFALWHEEMRTISMPSFQAIFGVCGLAFLGTVCAFILYYKLLEHCGPTAISMVACAFPVGGMLLGFIFLGESLALNSLLGALVIFLGMLTVNNVITIKFLQAKEPAKVFNEIDK